MHKTLRAILASVVVSAALGSLDAAAQATSFTVLKVTSLADSGPGTLRDCIDKAYARVCVFEVSGRIKLATDLVVTQPDLIIAGQTAPSPGIMLTNASLSIRSHHVRVEHLSIRPGDSTTGSDPRYRDGVRVKTVDAHDINLKNLSVSWAVNQNLATNGAVSNVTIENSIISEALYRSIHPDGLKGQGVAVTEGARKVIFVNNLIASNHDRNIRWRYNTSGEMINNIIYGWGGTSSWNTTNVTDLDRRTTPTVLDIIGNRFIPGPQGLSSAYAIYAENELLAIGSRLHISGNVSSMMSNVPSSFRSSTRLLTGPAPMPVADAYEYVLTNAGSRPWDRNADDVRVIAGVRARTLRLRDSVGTWPVYATNYRVVNVSDGLITLDRLNEALAGFEKNVVTPLATATPMPTTAPTTAPTVTVQPTQTPIVLPTSTPTPAPTSTPATSSTPTPAPTASGSTTKMYSVIKVTNLNDTGAGSLRDCVSKSVPRVCVFETSGRIRLATDINVTTPDLIVAGQTAPSPGIMVTNAGITVKSQRVRIEHITVRVGDEASGPAPSERDGLGVDFPADTVKLKNISVSWAIDENFSTYQAAKNVVIENCMIAEALNYSLHPKGRHSMGALVGETARNISFVGNLLASNADRNVRWKFDATGSMVNNVIYGWGGTSSWNLTNLSNSGSTGGITLDVIGNVYRPGPQGLQTPAAVHADSGSTPSGTRVFILDNIVPGKLTDLPPQFLVTSRLLPGVAPIPASSTFESVMAKAGARPWDRNADDLRIIAGVRARTLPLRDKVGTWPVYAVNKRDLSSLGTSISEANLNQALVGYEK